MKKILLYGSLLSLGLLSIGCSDDSSPAPKKFIDRPDAKPAADKSEQISFRSPLGFQFKYNAKLKLEQPLQEEVVVTNAHLTRSDRKPSILHLKVIRNHRHDKNLLSDQKELEEFARSEKPELKLKSIEFPGAIAVYTEVRETEHLDSTYFILTDLKDLITVEINANPYAGGFDWLSKIVETFSFDGVPPEILRVFMEKSNISSGKAFQVFVEAKDNFSGIDLAGAYVKFVANFETPETTSPPSAYGTQIRSLGSDLYSIEVTPNEFLPSGTYALQMLQIKDRIGNVRSLLPSDLSARTLQLTSAYRETSLSILSVNLSNSGKSDTKAPSVTKLWVDSKVFERGRKASIYFEAEDDISGIRETAIRASIKSNFVVGDDSIRFSAYEIRHLEGNRYALDFEIRASIPLGEYYIENFQISDIAGNLRLLMPEDLASQTLNPGARYSLWNGEQLSIPFFQIVEPVFDRPEPLRSKLEIESKEPK